MFYYIIGFIVINSDGLIDHYKPYNIVKTCLNIKCINILEATYALRAKMLRCLAGCPDDFWEWNSNSYDNYIRNNGIYWFICFF